MLVLCSNINSREWNHFIVSQSSLARRPSLLYWITRVWLLAHRGEMHEEPNRLYSERPASYIVGLLVAAVIIGSNFFDKANYRLAQTTPKYMPEQKKVYESWGRTPGETLAGA